MVHQNKFIQWKIHFFLLKRNAYIVLSESNCKFRWLPKSFKLERVFFLCVFRVLFWSYAGYVNQQSYVVPANFGSEVSSNIN